MNSRWINSSAKRNIFLILVFTMAFVYLVWRIFFTLPVSYGAVSMAFGILLLVCESFDIFEMLYSIRNQWSKPPEMPVIIKHSYPDVDIFIATHNEEPELLYKTINGCQHMEYPDKTKVHIYVCDDNNRAAIRSLAQGMNVDYLGLSGNKNAKAGNLNNALKQTHSPLVVTFDADMIPTSEFLMETVPYFFLPVMKKGKNKWRERIPEEVDRLHKIGFVQTPQCFYNADLFQYNLFAEYNIPNEQDYFFRELNVKRTRTNSVIYAGSNTVISREALESAGGFATGTITEDIATGIKIQERGYSSIAINKELAHGLSPNDFESLIKQRQRWGRGSVQVLGKPGFWFGPLPARAKFSYFISLVYWWTFFRRFVYIITPIVFAMLGIVFVDASLVQALGIWLPFLLFSYISTAVISDRVRNHRWSSIYNMILFPYMIFPIIAESLGLSLKNFSVTPKEKSKASNTILYSIPHFIFLVMTFASIVACLYFIIIFQEYNALIPLFLLAYNFFMLMLVIVFMLGRANYRNSERLYIRVPVEIETGDSVLYGETLDVSENGMAVMLDSSVHISDGSKFCVTLRDKGYCARLEATIARVQKMGGKWKYGLDVTPLTEQDKKQYYQMIFDRKFEMPQTISSTAFHEIRTMLKGRFEQGLKS